VVRQLLANGAAVNARCAHYGTALYAAALQGHEDVVRELIAKGADVNVQGGRETAFYAACRQGHEDVVRLLIANGVDVNEWGGRHGTAFQVASRRGHGAVVRLLLVSGAVINQRDRGGFDLDLMYFLQRRNSRWLTLALRVDTFLISLVEAPFLLLFSILSMWVFWQPARLPSADTGRISSRISGRPDNGQLRGNAKAEDVE
jgi:hypothetical protein